MSSKRDFLAACTVGDLPWLQKSLTCTGVDPNRLKNKEGQTGLHLAAIGGKSDCIRYLLDNCSIDINEADTVRDFTTLHYAVISGHEGASNTHQCVKLLLERGADHSLKDRDAKTALHHAAETGHLGCIKLLLERGADIDSLDKDGRTPCDLSTLYGHHDCARLLKALHWASSKDRNIREEVAARATKENRDRESRSVKTRIRKEEADKAYAAWRKKKNLPPSFLPRDNKPEHPGTTRPHSRPLSCEACSSATAQRRYADPVQSRTLTSRIKISHHQEAKNIQGVGRPERLYPYVNYPPMPTKNGNRRPANDDRTCRVRRVAPGKPIHGDRQRPLVFSAPSAINWSANPSEDDHPGEVQARPKQNAVGEEGSDGDGDVDVLFHDVDQPAEFRSSALPTFINRKHVNQLLRLIAFGGLSGTKSTDALLEFQSHANRRHASYRRRFHRRFSLGAIPEGQVVVHYESSADRPADEVRSPRTRREDIEEIECQDPDDMHLEDVEEFRSPPGSSAALSSDSKPPPPLLTILNFKWDDKRSTVSTEAISSPLTPNPHRAKKSGKKLALRRFSAPASSSRMMLRTSLKPRSAPSARMATAVSDTQRPQSFGLLASKSMVMSSTGNGWT